MRVALLLAFLCQTFETTMAGFCAQFCLVPYRLTMRAVLVNVQDWSLEMMSPIQTIIRKTEDAKGARRKLNWACLAMKKYRGCLDACSGSLHKQVVMIGMAPWNELCSALQVRHSGMEEFLRCFKEHSSRIDAQCEPYELTVKELLNNASQQIRAQEYGEIGEICRAMQQFETCYKNAERPCEEKAWKLWRRLQQSASEAFQEIIAIDFVKKRLPFECKSPHLLTVVEPVSHTPRYLSSSEPMGVTESDIDVYNETQAYNLSSSAVSSRYHRFMYSSAVLVGSVLFKNVNGLRI